MKRVFGENEDIYAGGKVRLTQGDYHITVDESVLEDPEVFYKNYAWSYEKECRYVINLKEKWNITAKKEGLTNIRVKMSNISIKKMSEDRLVRSPVYSGGVACGVRSALSGDVEWNL